MVRRISRAAIAGGNIVLLLCMWALLAAAQTSGARPDHQASGSRPKYVEGQLLVKFRRGSTVPSKYQSHAAIGAEVKKRFRTLPELELVRLPIGLTVKQALRHYSKDPSVQYAEPDYVVHLYQNSVTPNDPRFAELWGMQKINAPQAWSLSTGSPQVVVGVIDTGVDYTHSDLVANMFRNEADCNNNGIDDDGNGFVDDCYGIDSANNDSDPMDDHGHGTHVSGTIGAAGNNGVGVVGVNWLVKIAACKFLGADGYGETSDAIKCLDYFATLRDRGVNLVATNNSWGGSDFSQALLEAIDSQRQRGILFIAAAGNSDTNNDGAADFPSNYYLPNVIAVAATDREDNRASFSSFGRHSVHVAAPGVDILSTAPDNSYVTYSGTSMATPHVTGVAALLAARDPTRDWKAIKNLILAGGDANSAMANTISQKRLNAYGALTCSNSIVRSRLLPRSNSVYATAGEPQLLSALHINCASPNGAVQVSVDSGAATISLADDGFAPDQEAGDGVYSGQHVWSLAEVGDHTLTFPNNDVVTIHVIPHLSPYVFSTAVPFNYRYPILDEGGLLPLLNLGDDDTALVVPPFPVQFGGVSFPSFYVSSNGVIAFREPFASPADSVLPTTGTRTLVAPFWDDLYPPSSEHRGVLPYDLGSAPNREFVVEWRGVPHYDCRYSSDATVSFQVVFTEGSSDILFNYADVTFGSDCAFADLGASATVGVQVEPGLATQFSFDAPSLSDHSSILWQLGQLSPTITRLSPFTALEGDPGFALRVFGANFFSDSVVRWNGSDRPTTFVNSTELKVAIPASDLSAAATLQVSVLNPPPNGGGSSPEVPFRVYSNHPVPSLTGLSPATLLAPAAAFTLTVTGSEFVSGSVIRWNGSDRPTTMLNSTQATATIPESDLADGGLVQVTIFNPAPGGGTSNPLTFTLENRVPTVTQAQPYTAAVGVGFTLQVYGSAFVPSSVVRWGGIDQPTTFVSSAQLTASIQASAIAKAEEAQVTVVNPSPGGGTSNAFPVTVYDTYPAPTLTSLSPFRLTAPYGDFTLTVTGAGFVSASVVRWNGASRPTTVLSSTQAQAQISASDVADGGLVQVTVFTPTPGGGVSNPLTLTVENPAPLIDSISPAAVAPGASFTLTVSSGFLNCADPDDDPCYGSLFVPSSVVRWNGNDRPTLYLNADRLQATIPPSDIAAAGTAQITVFTPPPGGGTSNPVPIAIVPRPPNDNFADALPIAAVPFTHNIDTRTATTEASEPDDFCIILVNAFTGESYHPRPNQSVWYKFTPSSDTTVRANMIGSNFNPIMAVLTGGPNAFTLIRCTRADWAPPWNEHFFLASAGTNYYFRITSFRDSGNLVFNVGRGETLSISRAGSGAGTVTSNPAGIDCGATCSAPFTSGTVVTLTATPASGSVFAGWSGACSGSGTCSVTMDAARNITATFGIVPPFDFGGPPTPKTITAGQSAQFTVEVVGQPGFAGTVSFACSSGVPPGAACSFNPPSAPPAGGSTTTLLTITTTARTLASSHQSSAVVLACLLMPLAFIFTPRAQRSRQWVRLTAFGILLVVIGTLVACGGGSATTPPVIQPNPNGTPAGTYTITITGTSGSSSRTQNITLVVN